jgi:ribonuclease HII
MSVAAPSLRVERGLLRTGHLLVCGCDEVGRGALGGPVSVGVVLLDAGVRRVPGGVRDSKLLTPAAREALVPRIHRWVLAHAVGHASAAEIDSWGLLAALRLAGHRALAALPVRPDLLLLDGNHDYLSVRPAAPDGGLDAEPRPGPTGLLAELPPVATLVKADLRCASVAAASVLAKTARDAIMRTMALEHPHYGWAQNKAYATPLHLRALREHGPCEQHRRSWRLPAGDQASDPAGDNERMPVAR